MRGVQVRCGTTLFERPTARAKGWADFWLGLQLDWDLWHAMHSPEAKQIAKLEPISA